MVADDASYTFCAVSLATYKISIPLQSQYSCQYEVLWMAVNPDVVSDLVLSL
jgi:hypothetical protein